MCFSASASFIAGGGLIALGGATLVVAKKEERVLATIPFLFGIQQIIEGIQWLYIDAGSLSLVAGFFFLFFAFIVWPIWVPATIYILDKKRRSILKWFAILGIVVACYFLTMFLIQSLEIQKVRSCIQYNFTSPFGYVENILYLVAIFAPLLVSSRRVFFYFGFVVIILALISWLFYAYAFTSVWCFFSAVISSLFFVYVWLKSGRKVFK